MPRVFCLSDRTCVVITQFYGQPRSQGFSLEGKSPGNEVVLRGVFLFTAAQCKFSRCSEMEPTLGTDKDRS